MGININDLNNSSQPISASPLSSDENMLANVRELSEKELKISGGTGNSQFFQPFYQSFYQPVSQPVDRARPLGSNININVSSNIRASSNSEPVIVTEPEPERPPTTVSY